MSLFNYDGKMQSKMCKGKKSDCSGQALLEYGLILALISMLCFVGLNNLEKNIHAGVSNLYGKPVDVNGTLGTKQPPKEMNPLPATH